MLKAIDGLKTYGLLGLGAAIVIANHLGFTIPGVTIDDAAFSQYMWGILVATAANHGIHKGIAK